MTARLDYLPETVIAEQISSETRLGHEPLAAQRRYLDLSGTIWALYVARAGLLAPGLLVCNLMKLKQC